MDGAFTLLDLHGTEVEPWLDGLGELRISVFHEYPYLYDGTLEYEREYLMTYVNTPDSLVVLVLDDAKQVVGATTCLPLRDEGPEFQAPFLSAGYEVNSVCYFGESILLPQLRGQGLGKEFFKRREAHARKLGCRWSAFCAVDRMADHPLRPPGYRVLDDFWVSQGYQKHPELQATFVWKEIGEESESPKTLTFWLKDLS
ncbi:GNAT family N-acetyltransferase [Verrucomicrobium sp. BvORR106]|uniref:GNAT family N-acetyltransferase n=1 Tax=Verrucomicrobium sp. BvORR106 TaxID=1403819 RepID=UPI000570AA07|nr:GNAT family N-acetyltransferase [Verrucomicrobium sp. BvORR106]